MNDLPDGGTRAAPRLERRLATIEDAADLFAWRNDPITRQMSLSTDLVSWSDHVAWYQRILDDPNRELTIYALEGKSCATTRLDHDGDTIEISITVAPWARGLGVGQQALLNGLPSSGEVTARIRSENASSLRLFTKAGFEIVGGDEVLLLKLVRRSPNAR